MIRFIASLMGLAAALASAAPATAADKVRAAIGQRGLWDTSVVAQAVDKGFFQKEGIEVEITWTRGGAETLQTLITGSADFAMANGTLGVIGAFSKGAPIRVVSAEATGAAELFWYVKAESAYKSLKDLDGKSVGYSRPGSSTHLVIQALAEAAGVNPKLVSSGGIPDTRTQVMSGQIEAGWSVPPLNLDLLADNKIRIVARGSDDPRLDEQTVRVNVASLKMLTERRDVARRFMKVYAETIDWMYANQKESVAFWAGMNKVPVEVAQRGLEFYPRPALALAPVRGLKISLDQALHEKAIDKPMTVQEAEKMIDLVHRPAGG